MTGKKLPRNPTGVRIPTGSRQRLIVDGEETEAMAEARRAGAKHDERIPPSAPARNEGAFDRTEEPPRPARVNGAEWERTSTGCFCDHCGAQVRFTVLNSRTDARCVGCGLEWEGWPGKPWKRWKR